MGALKPSTYLLAIIMFTFFIMAGVAMMGEFRKSDVNFMTDTNSKAFNNTFNKYTDLTTSVTNLQTSVTDAGSDWGVFGVVNALVGSAWNSLRLLFTSFSFMNGVFAGLEMFGIPSWVGGLATLTVTVILAFAIFSAIFNSEA